MSRTWITIIAILIFGVIAPFLYKYLSSRNSTTELLSNSKTDTLKLTFIVGNQVNYYEGNLTEKKQLRIAKKNKSEIAKIARDITKNKNPYEIIVKPSYEGNSIQTFMTVTGWLYEEGIEYHKRAELNENEQKFLGFGNPPNLISGESEPLKLFLPKDSQSDNLKEIIAKAGIEHLLTVILYGQTGIYVYEKGDLARGKKIEYKDFRSLLKNKKTSDKELFVVIKPGTTATYKNTVDMLDEMAISDISKYAIVDINENEAKFIDSLLK